MVTNVLLLPSAQLSPFVCRATRSTGISMVPTKVPNLTSSLSSASLSLAPHPLLSPPSDPFLLASTVGSPPPPPPRLPPLRDRDILLNVAACTAAISASWLFLSAIPTLLAFKSAAESLEKLLDVTREELPDTMAAVRLSGMEISDLTMELSDLGQEITQGVRSSTRAIRLAEDRLRQFTAIRSPAPVQFQDAAKISNTDSSPASAKTARRLREGIVKGRALLGALSSLTQFSRFGWNFLTAQKKQRFP